ncbi:MAG: hypothetical protein EXS10_01575 [Phycisphaerales bacterium]|nr:hypothetical protein [Phycisphaerales bacterium]
MTSTTPAHADDETTRTDRVVLGDRLCAACLHPMAGSPIERHLASKILFARCMECGTPSPLLEYPTATPWIRQLQTLATSAVLMLALFFLMVQVLLCLGCVVFMKMVPLEFLIKRFFTAGKEILPVNASVSYYSLADIEWVNSADGGALLASSCDLWSFGIPLVPIGCLGLLPAIFSGMLGGVIFMRGSWVRRIAMGNLATVAFCIFWYVSADDMSQLLNTPLWAQNLQPTWEDVIAAYTHTSRMTLAAMTLWIGSLLGTAIGPSALRLLATTVLPPRERNLVAWIWTFAGKSVPNR